MERERAMPIRAVVYVSEASNALMGDKLGLRGASWTIWWTTQPASIETPASAAFFFDGERFLQYLEGPSDGLDVAYSRVLGASSHHHVLELQRSAVSDRRLPFWPMKWLP